MSEIQNWQEGFDYFLRLAKKNGINPNKDSAELRKGLEEAAGSDGILTFDEAKSYFYSSSEMAELEDEFMDAFEAIAKSDGVYETISMDDLSEQTAAQMAAQAQAAQAAGNSGGKKGGGQTPGADNPASTTPSTVQAVSADSLKDKSTSQLQSERQGVTSALAAAREQKAAATEQYEAGVETAQAEYDAAVENIETLIENVEANKEQVSKEAEKVNELSDKRDALTGEIEAQKSTISETESNISNLNSQLGSLKAPVESDYQKEETYIEDGVQKTRTVTDTAAYNAAVQAYEAQKQELEQQIADAELNLQDQEEALTELETQKTEVEQQHYDAVEAWCKANKVEKDGNSDLSLARQALTQEKGELSQVKSEKPDVAQFDANIAQLRDNLEVYSDVILEQQNPDIPEGYKIEDGKIVEENPPEGATPKELNSVTEEELKAELGDGVVIPEGDDTSIKVNGEIVGQVTRNEEGEVTGYFLFDNPKSNNTFDQNYALAQELFNGYTPDEKGAEPVSAEDAMANFDFTGYSQEDIESIGRMYDQMVADYNETVPENEHKPGFAEASREAIVNQLVEGYTDRAGNAVTPEQVWASFDFKGYSKEEIAAMETLYNEKVAHVDDAFNIKANEEVLGDELAYINSAINGTEYVDMSTLSGYLESKGIDIENTSPELISMYSRTYLAEKTDTQVTLNDSEIAEVANMLKNSNDIMLNGDELTPKDLWSQHDFAQYSPETIAKIANVYNEGLEEGDKNFLEMVAKSDAPQEQFDEVVAGVIASGNEEAIAMVDKMVDDALSQADDGSLDFSILNSITKAADKYPEYIQNYIEDSGLADKIEGSDIEAKIPAAITNKLDDIKNMHIVSYENQQLIDKLNVEDANNPDEVAEAEEAWKNLDIDSMTPEQLQDLQRDYDSIHGDGSFMDKAAEIFGKSSVDSIYDAIADLEDTGKTGAALSDNKSPSDIANSLTEDNFADVMANYDKPEDIAKIASNYPGGVEAFMEEYTYNFGDGKATEYTQIREKIAQADNQDQVEADKAAADKVIDDSVDAITQQIDNFAIESAKNKELGKGELPPETIHGYIDTAIENLSPEQRMLVLQELAGDEKYGQYIDAYMSTPENANALLADCTSYEQVAEFAEFYNSSMKTGADDSTNYFSTLVKGNVDGQHMLALYQSAKTPEDVQKLNELYDPASILPSVSNIPARQIIEIIAANYQDVNPTFKVDGSEMTPEQAAEMRRYQDTNGWGNDHSNTVKNVLKAYDNGNGTISRETAIWLLNDYVNNPDNDATYSDLFGPLYNQGLLDDFIGLYSPKK